MRCLQGLAELEQLHMESNSPCSRHLFIPQHSRLGYKRAGPSGLAELEQLHVESNSECNRHFYLSSALQLRTLEFTLARLITLVSTWLGYACSVRARHDADTSF